jgi:site-specific DNA-methyltransferase (adenine-specific)
VLHDGSDEVLALFPESSANVGTYRREAGSDKGGVDFGVHREAGHTVGFGDSGSAARFSPAFPPTDDDLAWAGRPHARAMYAPKAGADDRAGSKHPTVKPVALMQWLVRLITPPGGTVLDLFAGTGTTGEAAFREGFNAVLIEREAEYQADIAERMRLVMCGPDERRREIAKRRDDGAAIGGLFEMEFDD